MGMYAVGQAKGEGEETELMATTKILLLKKKKETNQQY